MKALKIAVAATAMVATSAPAALAQYTPTPQYERDLRNYEDSRQDYEDARRDYERRLSDYNRARDRYDRRYGYGAYARAYGPAPAWDDDYWDANRYGSYASQGGTYNDPCRNTRNNRTALGGVIGALAGAALGSNVAARNARTEGAVLGAVVGGAIGAGVGRANANYKCDSRGPYYSYDQTIPYRESNYYRGRNSGRYNYSYYERQGCRLAPAPVDEDEYRYVRVCPDRDGNYRITG
jgi:hypothetical protein